MIDRAIVLGFLLSNRIPRTIDYKLSIDGSNLGSRNCELVTLTPMNLGYNPNSLHSIFPLMLYEGKERREDLKAVLSPLNTQLKQLKQPHNVGHGGGMHTCHFFCSADYFALVKLMRPAKDELLSNGKKAQSCTCSFCGEQRKTGKNDAGWSSNIDVGVWDSIPKEILASAILDIELQDYLFCILHMKVRIVGSLLKHMLREAEMRKQHTQFKAAMTQIIRTFQVTLKGDTFQNTGKKNTKAAKVGALQGQQVDKVFAAIRASTVPTPQRTPEQQLGAAAWGGVLTAALGNSTATIRDSHTEMWQLLVQCYDTLNSHTHVTAAQLSRYRENITKFGNLWTQRFGLKKVTPYVHIMVKHSGAYLAAFGSLRNWSQEAFEASHKRHKQLYTKTNFGGGKHGDPSSAYLQVVQKLYRRQYLQTKVSRERRAAAKAYLDDFNARKTRRRRTEDQLAYKARKTAAATQRGVSRRENLLGMWV